MRWLVNVAAAVVVLLSLVFAGPSPAPTTPAPPPPKVETFSDPKESFFAAPQVDDVTKLNAKIAFLGVPFDAGGWDVSGQREAPRALRHESMYFSGGNGVYDFARRGWILKDVTMADLGNVTATPADFGPNFDRITTAVRAALDQHQPLIVAIGGDHSATFPIIRGFDKLGKRIQVIHFDSHLDFSEGNAEVKFSHASPMRRVVELSFIKGITSIGTRGVLPHDRWVKDAERLGATAFSNITAEEAMKLGAAATIARIPKADAYYVTWDVDVLDPSVAPATGTPEPGGFDFYFMRSLFAEIAKQKRVVVGFDVMEHLPALDDASHRSAHVIARLMLDFLADLEKQGRFR